MVDDAALGAAATYALELQRWRERRGLSKQKLADRMAYDRSYVSHIESGKQRPTEAFTKLAEEALDTSGALWACWEAINDERARAIGNASSSGSKRDLRTVDFVAWIADHSDADFAEVYQSVATLADRLEAEPAPTRHTRSRARAGVSRADLASAIADYYGDPSGGRSFYAASVDGTQLTTSLLVQPAWLGVGVMLGTAHEEIAFEPRREHEPGLDEVGRQVAIRRLAEAEVADTVMVNSLTYQLHSLDLGAERLRATFGPSDFASFALTSDLMENELVDAIALDGPARGLTEQLALRGLYLPSFDAVDRLDARECAGGPATLFAVARAATTTRPADYALLIQERSGRVLNAAGKLAVIPKAFHQPIDEPADEVQLVATIIRELEEELLGREDLEQLSVGGWRKADPLHLRRHSEPMAWLLEHQGDGFRTECTGFGYNLINGTYEFACLVVIDDETWWDRWGHTVEANWETMRIHRHSSLDTGSLAALALDPRWSNEGLFAYIEGLRRLTELDDSGRVAVPPIHLEVT